MKAVPFTNTTATDFEAKWDGEPQVIKSGQTRIMEYGMAYSFARRLAVRECNEKGILPNKSNIEPLIHEYLADEDEVSFESTSKQNLQTEIANLNEMKKDELVAYAKEKGVKINPQAKKDDIKSQIEEFEQNPNEDTE